MFGLGIAEITIILVVALLVLGPKRLPEAARSLGRGLAEFRRASNDIRNALVLEAPEPGPPVAGDRPAESTPPPPGQEASPVPHPGPTTPGPKTPESSPSQESPEADPAQPRSTQSK